MTKQKSVHHDRIGNQLGVGDVVAVAMHNDLVLAKVTKLNPKMIRVEPISKKNSVLWVKHKFPRDAIKLNPDDVAFYILQGGH